VVENPPRHEPVGAERSGKVELEQVLVRVELEPEEPAVTFFRPASVDAQAGVAATVGPPDEKEPGPAQRRQVRAEVRLDRLRDAALGQLVTSPETAVLDEEPVVDAARGRGERLAVRLGDLGAEGSRARAYPDSTTQIT
jgi:hypothetical protein